MRQVQTYYDRQAKFDGEHFDWKVKYYRGNRAISRSFDWIDWRGKRVLEIGCGPGYYSIPLASRCNQMVAIDLSSENIRVAKQHAERLQVDNVHFVQANLFEFTAVEPFDVVFLITVLMHIPELEAALARIRTFLNPGGYLLISDLNRYFHRRFIPIHRQPSPVLLQTFTFKTLRSFLNKTGFKVIRESGRLYSIAGLRKPEWAVSLQLEQWAETWPLKYMGEHVAVLAQRV